jgi:hypothetical protein
MKVKRITFWVAVFVLVSLMMVSVASAAWYECTIKKVGSTPDGYMVYLRDNAASPAFTNRRFELSSKELLAVALTTYANSKVFCVNLDTLTAGTVITEAYMTD